MTLYNSTVLRSCTTLFLLLYPPPQLRVGLHPHAENVLRHPDVVGGGLVLVPVVVAGRGHVRLPVLAGDGHVLLSVIESLKTNKMKTTVYQIMDLINKHFI